MKNTLKNLLLIALFSMGAAFAESKKPNYYECSAEGINVRYVPVASFAGRPFLDISIGEEKHKGTNLRTVETVAGTLVSLEASGSVIPEDPRRTISLLVPHITSLGSNPKVEFKSLLVDTITRYDMNPHETSQFTALECSARIRPL